MDSKGSITLRKGYFLNYRTCFLLFFIVLFLNQEAETLRTGSSTKARSKSKDDLRSRSISSSSLFLHPAPKERRLSFLNHQLSLLGGKVGPESRISSKIYSHLGDSTTGTDEISSVDVPPNSDIVVGKEIPKGTRILLECQAEFPVNWIYQGDGAPQMQTNTTIPASKKKAKYSATALIGSDDGVVDSKETGEYICRNTQNPEESIRYYIFVPGKSYFIRRGGIIKLSPNDNSLRIPCSISNPDARVTILKSDKGYLTCVVNDTMNYSKKSGFTLKLVEDDENDVAGLYVCMAGVNDSYQLAEYSVIRSYENSTYEYNWEERSVIYDDEFSSELGRNDDICSPNPCGPNAICEVKKNQRTGDPFTCRCEEGYRGKAPKCRSNSLCAPNPCGPNSVCTEDSERNYPRCTCQETYIGRPPNCRPECNLNIDCHPSLNCVNNTCQNPCLSACSLDAVCTVQNHVARCSCPIGTAGDPSNGGTCHKIRLPSLQFFPFFGLRPRPPNRPRPNRPPVRLQEEPQQIFPGDSLPSTDYSEEYSAGELNTISNSCENWPCGPHSQCTPVGEFAHCKCNAGYVGLPPNCRPESVEKYVVAPTLNVEEDITKQNATAPAASEEIPSQDAPHPQEKHLASLNLKNCWNVGFHRPPTSSPPPSSSGGSNSQQESSSEEHQTTNKNPSQRPGSRPGQRPPPRPSNPQENGRPTGPISDGGNNNGGSGSSCTNFCGKNAVCVQRNSTVTCRCKQGYTGPGSDPYTECTPSRNPCHKCGPNSVCRVMGNGSPVCECQPGKLGSPPNCRDNVCRYNNDCPQEQACFKRTCADPCGRARCGQYATCKAINHFAVCACPNDPDKDPLEEGGCPPPEVSSSGRPKRPGFFPPTRFFI
ncbi:Slit 3 protein [Orchesella cincta]|uniref:Slit 3 protein n=1 Tax=Orchesella cincta TaxID=48709 RepID=A0A1D2NCM6_ORCCI|nr:Slit 3 protein [Orchesella cincta]